MYICDGEDNAYHGTEWIRYTCRHQSTTKVEEISNVFGTMYRFKVIMKRYVCSKRCSYSLVENSTILYICCHVCNNKRT